MHTHFVGLSQPLEELSPVGLVFANVMVEELGHCSLDFLCLAIIFVCG